MRTIAYCCQSFAESVARAAGVTPTTSPPATWRNLPGAGRLPDETGRPLSPGLQKVDLLYLKLHGVKHEPYLYGDNWTTALHTTALAGLDLSGLTVFSACCHFFDTPWPDAFAEAGCDQIIAGHGLNWARSQTVAGADRLGRLFRIFLSAHMPVARSLDLAKFCLAHTRDRATQDALQFHLWGTCELPAGAHTPEANT
jgi:hypothetical protein